MTVEPRIGDQLGLPRYRYFILCDTCIERIEGDHHLMLALFGPQGLGDEDAVLVCVPWGRQAVPSQAALCDGCGGRVAYAPSSTWFVVEWAKERAA